MARVAWPQRGTSTAGVNHRSFLTPSLSGDCTNAVSERFISAAMACILSLERGSANRQTAAGFPEKMLFVKASTWYNGNWIPWLMSFFSGSAFTG